MKIENWEYGDRVEILNPDKGGMRVSTEWEAKNRHVNLFPLWVWNTGHPPYSVGVRVFSYGGEWNELELKELVLTQGERKYHPVNESNPVITSFEKWDPHPASKSIYAQCLVNIGEWPINDPDLPITMRAVYTVRGLDNKVSSVITAIYTFKHTKTTGWFMPIHD